MSGYWKPADVGIDPANYADGQVPVKDGGTGRFAPGAGGGGGNGGGGGAAHDELVGDGTEVTFDVTHDLGTPAIVVAAWEVSSGDKLEPVWLILDDDTVRVTFAAAPDEDDALVVVLASGGDGGGSTQVDEVRIGLPSPVLEGNTLSSVSAAWVRFVAQADVTLTEVRFPVATSGSPSSVRLRVYEVDSASGSAEVIAVLHSTAYQPVSAPEWVTFDGLSVVLEVDGIYAVTIEDESSDISLYSPDSSSERNFGYWPLILGDSRGGSMSKDGGVGTSLSQFSSAQNTAWLRFSL